jgi:hypothetical protein
MGSWEFERVRWDVFKGSSAFAYSSKELRRSPNHLSRTMALMSDDPIWLEGPVDAAFLQNGMRKAFNVHTKGITNGHFVNM